MNENERARKNCEKAFCIVEIIEMTCLLHQISQSTWNSVDSVEVEIYVCLLTRMS